MTLERWGGAQPLRGHRRLALKIYLVSVAAVLAVAVALYLAARLAWEPRPHPVAGNGRYAAAHLAAVWPSRDAIEEELRLLRDEAELLGTVYAWDGALVASARPPPPSPLPAGDLSALAREGILDREGGCASGPCPVAFRLGEAGSARGYLLLVPATWPPPPPGMRGMLPVGLLLLGLGIAAAVLGRSIARPLEQLARTAHALGAGDLSARTGIARADELGALARAFDEMAERVVALLRSQTELIANVAHELRTPLARIRVALDLAAEGDARAARASLAEIAEDLSELEQLVEDVLASARMDLAGNTATDAGGPAVRRERLDLAAVLDGAAERVRHRHPERTIALEIDGSLPAVLGDPVLLRRALDNLLDNARKYSSPREPIRLRAAGQGERAVVQVSDRGDGIAPEDLARLFTPFFRADPSRARATGGVGLGLTLTRRIVEAHGGTVEAASTPGAGTTMTVTLPALGASLSTNGAGVRDS
jgi:signal transduction histidine kinase